MKLEHYPIKKLKKQLREIIEKHLNLAEYNVFFFGSRARKDNFPRADIDIGIEGPKKIPADIKLKIEEELENLPILYKIDFVDFKNISQEFKKQALKNIKKI